MNKTKLPVLEDAAPSAASPAADTQKPTYWRSFAELDQTPEFRAALEREFSTPLEELPPNSPDRRRFMQIMGASFSLAGLAGCRWREDKIVPLSRRPEGTIPGTTSRYATAMELGGYAVGLHATSYDGRPIKIDGNPLHPASLGAAYTYHQASVLGVYDPDRSDQVTRKGSADKRQASTFDDFDKAVTEELTRLRGNRGEGLRVLAEPSYSPTQRALRERFLAAFPLAKWVTYSPLGSATRAAGTALAFGRPHRVHYALDAAKVVLALDSDLISPQNPEGLANARKLIKTRVPNGGEMSRIYAIESSFSLLGAIADHRLPLRSEQLKAVVAYLDAELSGPAKALPEQGAAQPKPAAAFLGEGETAKFLAAVVKDLLANVGASVVTAGLHQSAEVHALVERLNVLLGNVGRTVFYTEEPEPVEDGVQALKALVDEMNTNKVTTLLVLGGNPAYDAPADVPFAAALPKVATSIRLGLYEDETSQGATWHVPAAHYLESWGDAAAYDGTVSIVQPLISPIFNGRSNIEFLARLLGETPKGLELVRETHKATLGDERRFRKAVHDGVVEGTAAARVTPALVAIAPVKFSERELAGAELANGSLEITFAPCPKVYDGRFANNAWLQELPETFSKLSWDNAAFIGPALAQKLGVDDGHVLTLTFGGKSFDLPCVIAPGQAAGSVKVALGYGRAMAGRVGGDAANEVPVVGGNAYAIRPSAAPFFAGGLTIATQGFGKRLAFTQDNWNIDPLGKEGIAERLHELVRERPLEEFKKEPNFADHEVHHLPLLNLWQDPVSYEGHKWGMSIDLNKCIGCSACVTACQAENNIPVVGQKNTAMGREMLWLRVDRYYKGANVESPEVRFQPLPCMHCENAPCEQVCPVGATMHSHEGLNDMVYNRCIGTRYCSNNCPYKVRRFNYFNYNLDVIGETPYTPTDDPKMKLKSMVFNPEVTVRSRGVMEKCTFCVQRIQNVKIAAKNVRRPIADGEIKTACQETCPTDAIIFGDLNDQKAAVAKLQRDPRSYQLLGELNNRPRVEYLARVTNPNPELA